MQLAMLILEKTLLFDQRFHNYRKQLLNVGTSSHDTYMSLLSFIKQGISHFISKGRLV